MSRTTGIPFIEIPQVLLEAQEVIRSRGHDVAPLCAEMAGDCIRLDNPNLNFKDSTFHLSGNGRVGERFQQYTAGESRAVGGGAVTPLNRCGGTCGPRLQSLNGMIERARRFNFGLPKTLPPTKGAASLAAQQAFLKVSGDLLIYQEFAKAYTLGQMFNLQRGIRNQRELYQTAAQYNSSSGGLRYRVMTVITERSWLGRLLGNPATSEMQYLYDAEKNKILNWNTGKWRGPDRWERENMSWDATPVWCGDDKFKCAGNVPYIKGSGVR